MSDSKIVYEVVGAEEDGLKAIIYHKEGARFPYLLHCIDTDADAIVWERAFGRYDLAYDNANAFAYCHPWAANSYGVTPEKHS